MRRKRWNVVKQALVAVALIAAAAASSPPTIAADGAARVETARVPDGGIAPQVAADGRGVIHLIYFKGEPNAGDIYYVRSTGVAGGFSKPVRVNSQPKSALAIGTVRGPRLALGRNGRIHVAWYGSAKAEPRAIGGAAPFLYARNTDGGEGFEPQRNVIQERPGLDGGGSVAADEDGNVYLAWHAPGEQKGEANRRVWIRRSSDDGDHFGAEEAVDRPAAGACGCCGLALFASSPGRVAILYRTAAEGTHRDIRCITSADAGRTFVAALADPWPSPQCVMSTSAFAADGRGLLAAWESEGHVYWRESIRTAEQAIESGLWGALLARNTRRSRPRKVGESCSPGRKGRDGHGAVQLPGRRSRQAEAQWPTDPATPTGCLPGALP